MVSSGKIQTTLTEIHQNWSLLDLWEANALLTAYVAADAVAADRARSKKA